MAGPTLKPGYAGLMSLLCIVFVACGSSNDVTGPSRVPSVAGNYAGVVTAASPEHGESLQCPATTSVTQSGNSVTVGAIRFGEPCDAVDFEVGTTIIDANGALPTARTTFTESCGIYTVTVSGGFSNQELRIVGTYLSDTCLDLTVTIALSRQ